MKSLSLFTLVALTSVSALSTANAAAPGTDTLAGLVLEHMDLNSDGLIDGGEWQQGIAGGFDEIDALQGVISEATGDLGAKVAVLLIKKVLFSLDKNGDKLISRAEYMEGCEAIFKKLDANQDGQISKEELNDLPARLFGK